LVLAMDPPLTIGVVRKHLLKCLPAYMQPSRWLQVDDLPRLPNGKMDYQRVHRLFDAN
jgi:acyl-coenzyme A synthetase/AMP-(fatty) acid ligase